MWAYRYMHGFTRRIAMLRIIRPSYSASLSLEKIVKVVSSHFVILYRLVREASAVDLTDVSVH
jgi:hypothetical protein